MCTPLWRGTMAVYRFLVCPFIYLARRMFYSAFYNFPLYRPSRFLEKFRTQGFLRKESTAVQRCARKSTEFASGSKMVDENRGDMENFLVTQDSTYRGFCWTFPLYKWIDLHALIMNNSEDRVLRIERINTAVQRCASSCTELASQDAGHKGFCWTFPLNRPSRFLDSAAGDGLTNIMENHTFVPRARYFRLLRCRKRYELLYHSVLRLFVLGVS